MARVTLGARTAAALFCLGLAASALDRSPQAAPMPTLRPILTSGDPAGDSGTDCYVTPQTYPNGSVDSPRAIPSECVVEITDTLQVNFGDARPSSMSVTGPDGFSKTVDLADGLYLDLGMSPGEYRFEASADGHTLKGGFTVRLSSNRVVQLRFQSGEETKVDHLAMAGYAPNATVPLYLYRQLSYQPDVGTGTRTWGKAVAIMDATMDGRGEARVTLPGSLFPAGQNFLVASDPLQQNELNSGRVFIER